MKHFSLKQLALGNKDDEQSRTKGNLFRSWQQPKNVIQFYRQILGEAEIVCQCVTTHNQSCQIIYNTWAVDAGR